jgi:hypothetical protein
MTGSGLLAQRGMFAHICFVDQRATVVAVSFACSDRLQSAHTSDLLTHHRHMMQLVIQIPEDTIFRCDRESISMIA